MAVHSAHGELDPPSPAVANLIRTGASLILDAPEELFEEVDRAVFAASPPVVADDPVLAAAVQRQNRANLRRWAEANAHAPGAPVPAEPSTEALSVARDMVRRGAGAVGRSGCRRGPESAPPGWRPLAFRLRDGPRPPRQPSGGSPRPGSC